jgi:hypothetical protein
LCKRLNTDEKDTSSSENDWTYVVLCIDLDIIREEYINV